MSSFKFKALVKNSAASLLLTACASFSYAANAQSELEKYSIEAHCIDCTIYNICLLPEYSINDLDKYCTAIPTPQKQASVSFLRQPEDTYGISIRTKKDNSNRYFNIKRLMHNCPWDKRNIKLVIENNKLSFKN